MKLKYYVLGATLAADPLWIACSNENGLEDDKAVENGELKTYQARFRIVLPALSGTAARAADPAFAAGLDSEYSVKNAHFEFFDAEKRRLTIVSLTQDQITGGAVSQDGNVTQTCTVTLQANRQPKYVVVVLNANDAVYEKVAAHSMEQLKQPVQPVGDGRQNAIAANYANPSTGFLMYNSTYVDGTSNQIVQEIDVAGNIYETGESARPAADIYVERAVAKASVKLNAPDNLKDGDAPVYLLPDKTSPKYGVKFLSWRLNATNKTYIPLKRISNTWGTTDYAFWNGQVVWNNSNFHRSYWTIDGNYTSGGEDVYPTNDSFTGTTYPQNWVLNYYSLGSMDTEGKQFYTSAPENANQIDYCFENTAEQDLYAKLSPVTHVLIKAQYTDAAGQVTNENVYRFEKTIYTETAFKQMIVDRLKVTLGDNTLTTDKVNLKREENNYQGRRDVKVTVAYDDASITWGGLDKDNLNSTVFGSSTAWVYPQGICYYTVPIKHFAQLQNSQTGYYGVVRNHWYDLAITKVEGFGHPADPGKPVIPEGSEDDEYVLQCDIHVLSWAKVSQDATVGGGDAWN